VSNTPQTAQAGPVILQGKHDGIATLVMNRPDRLNALNNELAMAVNDALSRIAEDQSVGVVVITGAGALFARAGISARWEGPPDRRNARAGAAAARRHANGSQDAYDAPARDRRCEWRRRRRGHEHCAGRGHSHCGGRSDLRGEFRQGSLFPDFGGTYFLPQLPGPQKRGAFYTGDMIDARTALALGLVNQVVPAAQLEEEVKELAQKIAQGPLLAIRAVKKALFASQEKELARALDHEVREQIRCFLSEDCNEGIRAFFESGTRNFGVSSIPGPSAATIMTSATKRFSCGSKIARRGLHWTAAAQHSRHFDDAGA